MASSSKFFSPTLSRRNLLIAGAVAAPLTALGVAGGARAYEPAFGLTPVDGSPWHHPEIRSIDFRFQAEGVQVFNPSVRVTLPEGYDDSPDRRYPVLLLLHGGTSMFLDWSNPDLGNAVELTRGRDVILVMPDGGAGSFYANANQPLPGREAAWETFIMDRVLPYVHANFRTDSSRMAIAGYSMGGWGALALGQRYYGHFRSISAYSGPSDCNPASPDAAAVNAVIWAGPVGDTVKYPATANPPGSTWGGGISDYPDVARGYNPMENVEKYRGKRLFLRCGTGSLLSAFSEPQRGRDIVAEQWQKIAADVPADVQEIAVHSTNERFSAALSSAGIDHDYKYLEGRTHEWGLWRDCLAEDLPGMVAHLTA